MSKGSEAPEESWRPHSVEKKGPDCTKGVLRCLHGPEMALGKKGEIWRGCEETREDLTNLVGQQKAEVPILWQRGVQSALQGC